MTTTTSSSNSRSRPSGRLFDHQFFELYRTVVKQNLIPMGMYLVALLLTAVLPDYTSASQVDMSIITPNSLHPRVSSFAFCVLGFVVPVMLATMLFHYLHTRLSVDFYHGMPISRDPLLCRAYLPAASSADLQGAVPVHSVGFLSFCPFSNHPVVHPSPGFSVLGCPVQLHFHHLLHGGSHLLEYHREHPLFRCPQWCRLGTSVYGHSFFRLPLAQPIETF